MRPEPEELADFVAERARSDPKVQQVIQEAALFDGLLQNPGWKRLRNRLESSKDNFMLSLASRLMKGEKVDQRELDFKRGWFKGAEAMILTPEQAEVSLEAAAAEAWRLVRLEAALQHEESSPFLTTDAPPLPTQEVDE